jgi:ankyrin repeat protein/Leucine-rich repeat (LRR) protein
MNLHVLKVCVVSYRIDLFDEFLTVEALVNELSIRPERVFERNEGEDTPLTFACWKENWDVVEELVKAGADVNAQDGVSVMPLCARSTHTISVFAVLRCVLMEIIALHEHVLLTLKSISETFDCTYASIRPFADALSFCLCLQYGWTALMLASGRGHDEVVSLLIEFGANLEAVDKYFWTALMWASWQGHRSTILILLQSKANFDHVSENGSTSLHYAAAQGMVDAAEILIMNGARLEVVDNLGHTPLLSACYHGRALVVSVLLEHHADMMAKDNNEATSLHFACLRGKIGVVEILLDRGADVNAVDNKGSSPLHMACACSELQIAALLIDRGADMELADVNGMKPIKFVKLESGRAYLEEQAQMSCDMNLEDTLRDENVHAQYKLQLSNCKLFGQIPPFIGQFTHITALYLSRNKLSGEIPDVFVDLKALTILDLSKNKFTGLIPPSMGLLPNLINLNLSDNQLCGDIPETFQCLCATIEAINLSRNQLNGPIPLFFQDFHLLQKLDLSQNLLTGPLPAYLTENNHNNNGEGTNSNANGEASNNHGANGASGSPTNSDAHKNVFVNDNLLDLHVEQYQVLRDLYASTNGGSSSWYHSENWFSSECLRTWYGLTVDNYGRITGIKLVANHLRGTLPSSMQKLKSLESLDLSYNILTGYIPKSLKALTKLKYLNLFGNEFAGVIDKNDQENANDENNAGPKNEKQAAANNNANNDDNVHYFNEKILEGPENTQQQRILSFLLAEKYINFATWCPHTTLTSSLQFKVSDEWKLILVPHILFSSPELLSLCANPIVLLNKIKHDLYRFLYQLCKNQNSFVLQCLQRLWHGIVTTANSVPTEEEELMTIANDVSNVVLNIFHCNFMDNKEIMFRLLLPKTAIEVNDLKHWTNVYGNRAFIESAFTLLDGEFLGRCLHSRMKPVFGCAHVSNLLDSVFWGHLTRTLRSR